MRANTWKFSSAIRRDGGGLLRPSACLRPSRRRRLALSEASTVQRFERLCRARRDSPRYHSSHSRETSRRTRGFAVIGEAAGAVSVEAGRLGFYWAEILGHMSKGKDFRPSQARFRRRRADALRAEAAQLARLRRRPRQRLRRPADGRRAAARLAAAGHGPDGRRRRQMVQGRQGLRLRRTGRRPGRRVPARQCAACLRARERARGRQAARDRRRRRQGRAGDARGRGRHRRRRRASAAALVSATAPAPAAPRRARSVDRGRGHRQGQVVRRRQGLRLRGERRRRQGRVRAYLGARTRRAFPIWPKASR